MSKTAIVTARIDPTVKASAEQVFQTLGLTASQAITLFYTQVDLQQGLPFAVKVPNAVTQGALDDAQARNNLTDFTTPDELFAELDI